MAKSFNKPYRIPPDNKPTGSEHTLQNNKVYKKPREAVCVQMCGTWVTLLLLNNVLFPSQANK